MRLRNLTILATALMITVCAAGQTKGKNETSDNTAAIHLTTQEFKDKVYDYELSPGTFEYKGELPAIVDFFATWCRPCKALSPVLDELAKEYEGKIIIYKVDVDKEQELSGVFGIRSVPTLLFIPKDGSQPSMSAGAPSKEQLRQIIENMIK